MLTPEQLMGRWQLLSFTEQGPDGKWFDVMGAQPIGDIAYLPDGYMHVLMGGSNRPRFRGDWASIPDADRAACLDRMVSYCGTYSVKGDCVYHHVQVCWIPNWQGRDLVRQVSFPKENHLLLSTAPSGGDRPRPAQEVLWQRPQ